MRILVLDDYRPHGEALADWLQTQGHEVAYAESYHDAEWLLDLYTFNLAFLDFDMPGMIGPDAARKLQGRLPALRCIILSALPPTGLRKEQLGELEFLSKPVALETLMGVLREVEQALRGYPLTLRSPFAIAKYR